MKAATGADYSIGDTIRYRTFSEAIRTVKVTGKSDDIKNGRPGFDGISDGYTVWGYDSQIVD